MIKNLIILTLKGIRYRPTRSWLTVLGIVIGIMLVVIILALGSGIKNVVAKTLQSFGSNLIFIFPGKESNPLEAFAGGQKFRERDLRDLETAPGVRFVLPMEIGTLTVEFSGEKKSIMLHAAPWKEYRSVLEESQGMKIEKGRWPDNDASNEAVTGFLAATKAFKRKIRIGDEIIVKSKRFRVVGMLSEVGIKEDDNTIFISASAFRTLTGSGPVARSAILKIEEDANINRVAAEVRYKLSQQEVVRDFSVLTPDKAARIIDSVLSVIELALMVIAIVSLIVGAVGIMNTMYTSVLERTRQIGVMKAIGATNEIILFMFLFESGIIGLVGGILGILAGLGGAYVVGLVGDYFGFHGLFSLSSIDYLGLISILIVTFTTGVLSGILPARQAARMEPAEALRYE